VIAGFEVNIENLRAIALQDVPSRVVIVFEVAVPQSVHRPAFREALRWKAEELGLELSVQHREIFEAIHRL
jgi:glycine cleavage system transcriptional repressor